MQHQARAWRKALVFIGVLALVVLIFGTISYSASLSAANRRFVFYDALRLNFVQFSLWSILAIVIFRFSRRFPIELRPLRLTNLLIQFPALVLFAFIHQLSHIALLWSITPRLRAQFPNLAACYRAYFGLGFYIDLIIGALIIIAAHAALYYQRFHASEVSQASLKAQLAEAQLKALKMQLHPHFLFNTLHSISSLVLEDPAKANSMIARLGDFLRLTLEHSDEQFVTLQEEAEFLRCYLDIEQVRFGDRLRVEFNIDPLTLAARVPHLILQPVVENAIQHGIAPRVSSGLIKIEINRSDSLLRLQIEDNGPGMAADQAGSQKRGVGLSNVQARLRQIYGDAFCFEMRNSLDGGLGVTMEIPFRREREQ